MAESWQNVPYNFIVAPHCPVCGALKPISVRTEQNGDQSITRLSICRACSRRFKLVLEPPPEFGRERGERW